MIMGFFSNISGEQRSIFANELALDYNFVPKLIPFRDMQQKYIASCIKPLFSNRNGKNIVLFGPPGVGKTVATRHILNEMEEESDDIVPVYINCWNKNTSYKVAIEICDILDYKFTQNKKTEELFAIIKNLLNRKSAVFVFDEIDKAEDYDFLYTLLEDIYRKTIILITNYKSWVAELDDRIKSRLVPELLEFRAYNREEINGILKERAGYAFIPQCVEEPVFDFVAKRTIDMGGDVRTGIYMLREAGMIAEESGQGCVMIGHAEKATSKMVDFSIKKTEELDDETQKIFTLVKMKSGGKIGELFKLYQDEGGNLSYKSFQRKIAKLDENKFISAEKIMGGSEGTTTMISLPQEKKLTEF